MAAGISCAARQSGVTPTYGPYSLNVMVSPSVLPIAPCSVAASPSVVRPRPGGDWPPTSICVVIVGEPCTTVKHSVVALVWLLPR